jgi:flagellar M-ring protein FliF
VPEQFTKLLGDLKELLARLLSFLTPQQKRLIFLGLPLFGSIAYAGYFVFDRMNYGPLYTNLSAQDGAAVVKELEAEKIPYGLSGGGSVIEVPRGIIYQTRLKLAGKGVPVGGGVGFEIFEKAPFGVSEFTQQVNYLRAMQGELARTINAINAVQSSRVHLALPSRTSFLGPEEKPSASVVVDLKPGYHLTPDQVQGIVNLVASSVPKLSMERVTVIDSSGRPLKEIAPTHAGSEADRLNQLRMRHEQDLERRIETLLDPILGPGKVVARANVQVSLQETLMTKEQFDPENKVVRSARQAVDDSGGGGGTPGVQSNVPGGDATKAKETSSKRSSEMVMYEVGRTTSRISEPRGQIQRLSVAVLVDGKYEKDKYVGRTEQEMEVIKGMVRKAVGFNADRGDEIEVANVPFKIQPAPAQQAPAAVPDWRDWLTSPVGIGAGVGALLLVGAVIFMLTRGKSKKPVEAPAAAAEVRAPEPKVDVREEIPQAIEKITLSTDPRTEQLAQIARDYHDATVRIIRTWLQEDPTRTRSGEAGSVGYGAPLGQ